MVGRKPISNRRVYPYCLEAAGLLIWLPFEYSGTLAPAYDAAGPGHDVAALVNGASYLPDAPLGGNSVSLDGSDDYIEIQSTNTNKLETDMTLALWINPVNVTSTVIGCEKGNDTNINVSYGFGWSSSDSKLAWIHHNQFVSTSNYVMVANTWQHLVMRRKTSDSKIYYTVDGVDKGSFTFSFTPDSTNATLAFGTRGSGASRGLNLQGKIADIRIWNTFLPDQLASQLHTRESYLRMRKYREPRRFAPTASTYNETVSVDGVADADCSNLADLVASLTVGGFSAADRSVIGSYHHVLTVAGFSSCLPTTVIEVSVTVSATSDLGAVGGLLLFNQKEIAAISGVSALPGWGYFDDLSVDAVADIAEVGIRIQNDFLTIDGVADVAADHLYVAGASLSISGVSSISLTDTVDAVQVIVISSAASVYIENYWNTFDTVAVSDFTCSLALFANKSQNPSGVASLAVSATGVFNRTVTQLVALQDFATYKRTTGIGNQTLVISQTAACQKVHLETVAQTLALTDEADWSRPAAHTLVLTQTASVVRVRSRSVVQTLSLTQSGDRNIVAHRTVAQTLVFNQPRQLAAPIIGSQGGGDQTQFHYNQPLVNAVLRPRDCLVIIGVPAQSVVLPCPIFGDTQAYTGELNLKKTMTGDTFTYVKRTETEKLKYTFNVGTYKAVELRDFLIAHSHELITLHNWKGETWYVFLTNNPFDFTHAARWQPKGERVDITLEFEGIKT